MLFQPNTVFRIRSNVFQDTDIGEFYKCVDTIAMEELTTARRDGFDSGTPALPLGHDVSSLPLDLSHVSLVLPNGLYFHVLNTLANVQEAVVETVQTQQRTGGGAYAQMILQQNPAYPLLPPELLLRPLDDLRPDLLSSGLDTVHSRDNIPSPMRVVPSFNALDAVNQQLLAPTVRMDSMLHDMGAWSVVSETDTVSTARSIARSPSSVARDLSLRTLRFPGSFETLGAADYVSDAVPRGVDIAADRVARGTGTAPESVPRRHSGPSPGSLEFKYPPQTSAPLRRSDEMPSGFELPPPDQMPRGLELPPPDLQDPIPLAVDFQVSQ